MTTLSTTSATCSQASAHFSRDMDTSRQAIISSASVLVLCSSCMLEMNRASASSSMVLMWMICSCSFLECLKSANSTIISRTASQQCTTTLARDSVSGRTVFMLL